jgi:hypothetical protein
MHAPSATELLDAWERGLAQRPIDRALTLLAVALPDHPPGELARMSIGRRDGYLLALRERVFGPRMASVAACPGCGDRLELDFAAGDVRAAVAEEPDDLLALSVDGYDVRFRLPNSLDLAALVGASDPRGINHTLLLGCVEDVWRNGDKLAADRLPEQVAEVVVERMAAADPQADIQIALTCPSCERQWNELFDIAAFLWTEIDAWAVRTLRDVHTLALHYGWHEADILAMSAWRRQIYLGLVGA